VEAIVKADKIDFEAAFEPWPEQIETAGRADPTCHPVVSGFGV
jgi:hypothetical protein